MPQHINPYAKKNYIPSYQKLRQPLIEILLNAPALKHEVTAPCKWTLNNNSTPWFSFTCKSTAQAGNSCNSWNKTTSHVFMSLPKRVSRKAASLKSSTAGDWNNCSMYFNNFSNKPRVVCRKRIPNWGNWWPLTARSSMRFCPCIGPTTETALKRPKCMSALT